jgi:hypothetical protein
MRALKSIEQEMRNLQPGEGNQPGACYNVATFEASKESGTLAMKVQVQPYDAYEKASLFALATSIRNRDAKISNALHASALHGCAQVSNLCRMSTNILRHRK